MIRFIRWILGYIEFTFSGGFIEGFINDCYKQSINISRLDRIDDVLVGFVLAKNYKKLHRIAKKHGGKIRIIKKRGPIFAYLKIKTRYGLFAGAIAFLFIINFLSGFIWNVEITGNNKLANAQIENVLIQNNLKVGTHWSRVKRNNIENYIMSNFSDCAWVHINRYGTKAVVEIKESIPKPLIDPKRIPTNLKAKKDGIIVKAYTYGGWQVAQVGDSVKKGDLLVSGVNENEINKTNVYANANGEFIARVEEKFKLVVARRQDIKSYANPKKYKELVFYNIKLPLYFGKINYKASDVSKSERYLTFNDKALPIGIITTTLVPYKTTQIMLNDSELTNLINTEIEKKIEKELGKYEIINKNIDVKINENEAIASGYVYCLEDIGQMIKITKDDDILCSSTQNKVDKKRK